MAEGGWLDAAWGSGTSMRECLHVDDMAAASVHVMNLDSSTYQQHTLPMLSHINVGTGQDCTIRELAETISQVSGFQGRLSFDASNPDGTPRKLMDVSRLTALGWNAQIGLEDGLRGAYSGLSKTLKILASLNRTFTACLYLLYIRRNRNAVSPMASG